MPVELYCCRGGPPAQVDELALLRPMPFFTTIVTLVRVVGLVRLGFTRVAQWSTNPGTPSLDQQGLACAIYALALSCQVGGRESSHTRSHLNPITMTKLRSARFDAALSQILGGEFLQRVAPWERRSTGVNAASWKG